MGEFINFLQNNLADFWTYTGFYNATYQHFIMIAVGIFFIYLAVAKEFEPMLLIPIGFGMLIGNIPFNMEAGLQVGIYEQGSVLRAGLSTKHSLPRSYFWLVPAADLPRHWSYDRFLGIDFQSEVDVDWSGSAIRYLRCLHACLRMGI